MKKFIRWGRMSPLTNEALGLLDRVFEKFHACAGHPSIHSSSCSGAVLALRAPHLRSWCPLGTSGQPIPPYSATGIGLLPPADGGRPDGRTPQSHRCGQGLWNRELVRFTWADGALHLLWPGTPSAWGGSQPLTRHTPHTLPQSLNAGRRETTINS